MSLNTLFTAVVGVLTLSAGLAFTAVGAQPKAPATEVVSTTCGAGTLTKCGTRAMDVTCGFSIGVTPLPGLPFPGISVSKTNCTAMGSIDVFKDNHRSAGGAPFSVCTVPPKFPTDARRDDFEASDDAGEC